MQLGQGASQRQAETRSLELACPRIVDLPERRERDLDLVRAHANASIRNRELDAAGSRVPAAHRDAAATPRELDRVRQQIDQYLLQETLVRVQRRKICRQLDVNGDAGGDGALPHQSDAILEQSRHRYLALM